MTPRIEDMLTKRQIRDRARHMQKQAVRNAALANIGDCCAGCGHKCVGGVNDPYHLHHVQYGPESNYGTDCNGANGERRVWH